MTSQENIFTFTTDGFDYAEVDTKDGKSYYVEGHISTGDKDLVNDVVTKNGLKSMFQQLKERAIKLDFEHEAFRGETKNDVEVAKTKMPLGKAVDFTQDEKGVRVRWEMNPNWKQTDDKNNVVRTFKEVWSSVKSKFYDAFSIAYIPTKTATTQVKGENVRLLDDVRLLNVALTGNPVNPEAKMVSVMAKSLDFMKSHGDDTMTDKETKDSTPDEQEAQLEIKSLNEKVSSLEEQLKSIAEAVESKPEGAGYRGGKEDEDDEKESKSNEDVDVKAIQDKLAAETKARAEAEAQVEELKSELKDYKELKELMDDPHVKGFVDSRLNYQKVQEKAKDIEGGNPLDNIHA